MVPSLLALLLTGGADCPWGISPHHVQTLVRELAPDELSCELTDARTEKTRTTLVWRTVDGGEVSATFLPAACATDAAEVGTEFAVLIPAELTRACPDADQRLRQVVAGGAFAEPTSTIGRDGRPPPLLLEQLELTLLPRLAILALLLVVAGGLVARRRRLQNRSREQ